MSDERCALVLEGGAMRGMYTAGVLDCLWTMILALMLLSVFRQEHFWSESAVKAARQGYTIQ